MKYRTPSTVLLLSTCLWHGSFATQKKDSAKNAKADKKRKQERSPSLRRGSKSKVSQDAPTIRANRFPSIEERVKLYMSNWYVPPCPDAKNGFIKYRFERSPKKEEEWPILSLKGLKHHPKVNSSEAVYHVENIIQPDTLFYMEAEILQLCAKDDILLEKEPRLTSREERLSTRIEAHVNMRMYCADIKNQMLPALERLEWEDKGNSTPPTLLQFGDLNRSHGFGNVHVPYLKKFRSATRRKSDLAKVTNSECYPKNRQLLKTVHSSDVFQPIIWKLATHRHFGFLEQVSQELDTPWNEKIGKAIFRGQLTGGTGFYQQDRSDMENCMDMKRCRLVYNHAKSKLVDAKLTSTRRKVPETLNGVELVTSKSSPEELLKYKALIMVEGNDVASGLKWALLSQSVVLMPPPKYTSWAMEELLEPWVHYVPLDELTSNVEERMQWVLDHDEEAQRIAERASLWMEDLVFHPDAIEDDRWIQEEIMRRYQSHFLAA
eukprot:scaffold12946_cov116-Cylindrotheca_fusiformis.AAC.1